MTRHRVPHTHRVILKLTELGAELVELEQWNGGGGRSGGTGTDGTRIGWMGLELELGSEPAEPELEPGSLELLEFSLKFNDLF